MSRSPRSVSCVCQLSDVSLGTRPRYSLVADEDIQKPTNQTNFTLSSAPAKIKVSVGGTGSPQKQCHRVAMDKTDVDYSCSTNDDVSHVTVTGPGVRSLCSLYVIGGEHTMRNQSVMLLCYDIPDSQIIERGDLLNSIDPGF